MSEYVICAVEFTRDLSDFEEIAGREKIEIKATQFVWRQDLVKQDPPPHDLGSKSKRLQVPKESVRR